MKNNEIMKEENRKKIGSQILDIRTEQGWTQEQLGEMCGVKAVTIDKIEQGRFNVSLDVIGKVCDVLGVQMVLVEV